MRTMLTNSLDNIVAGGIKEKCLTIKGIAEIFRVLSLRER